MSFTYNDDTIEEKHHNFQKSKATHFYWMDMTPEKKKTKKTINNKELFFYNNYYYGLCFAQTLILSHLILIFI